MIIKKRERERERERESVLCMFVEISERVCMCVRWYRYSNKTEIKIYPLKYIIIKETVGS